MIVLHTYPESGKTIKMLEDSRFPNGPLSSSDEDMIEFLEYNIDQMRLAAKHMPADQNRQNLLLEMEKQKLVLNKTRRNQLDRLAREANMFKKK